MLDTADTAGYYWIQLDTYGYSWIQWDTAGYSGSAAEWLDAGDIQRDTKNTVRYRQDKGKIQARDSKNTRQDGRGGLVSTMMMIRHK